MAKPKYKTLLLQTNEQIKKADAELQAEEAGYKTQQAINACKLNISKLSQEIDKAKRADSFDAESLADKYNELALAERRRDQLEEIYSELF